MAVDPSTGEILASELTSTDEGDASQVGPLLVHALNRMLDLGRPNSVRVA